MRGFAKTLQRIWNCDGANSIPGIYRHILWQRRKFQSSFRIELNISDSKIIADCPIGVAPLINAMNMYDYNNMNLIKKILSTTNGIFVDVGANIGSYTLIASEEENSKIISIEPHPETFKKLVENINLNFRNNVIALNIALTAEDSEVFLSKNETDSTKHKIVKSGDQIMNKISIPGRKFDSICGEYKIQPLIVKIDVEGHEKGVLDGFQKHSNLAQLLIIENGDKENITAIMHDLGFIGPLYVHYKDKKILRNSHKSREDPIFFRENFRRTLKKIGLRIYG